jgi:hypothetical protein
MKKTIIILIALMLVLPTLALASDLPLAGWRSSAYGYQTASPPSYWINVANDISSKFPGTTPGGIWLVGETDGDPATGTILYMPSSGTYPNIRFEGGDIAEPYLTAFDSAGIKVILQVEPMNADVNTLIDIVMNRYKNHPSVIGFGVDNEWYKTCSEGCKATAAEVTSWNNQLHSINPNYILMIKHFDEAKLPTGIPTDVLVVDDDEDNGNLNTLVSEHVSMANTYPNNPYGAQYGYPSDQNIWGSMSGPVKQIGDAIKSALNSRVISIFWVDFSITTIYPPSTWDACTSNCNPVCTPKTCTDFSNQCGSFSDGCSGTLTCGCSSGKTCSNGICVSTCTPTTCSALGKTCGSWSNGCGTNLNCGTCTSGNTCNNGVCQTTCTPKTCSNFANQCGTFDNSCGGTLTCGCAYGKTCSSGVCVNNTNTTCTPRTCSYYPSSCGVLSNGCGGSITCNICTGNNTCVNNVCHAPTSCTPATCSSLGKTCGSYDDGCGSVLNCGTCPTVSTNSGGGGGQPSCVLKSCSDHPGQCGAFIDGCGKTIYCNCTLGECENGICVTTCDPKSCSDFANQCGQISNGCGGNITCGCLNGIACSNGICVNSTCTPNWTCETCQQNGIRQCTDGCGNSKEEICVPGPSVDFWKDPIGAIQSWIGSFWNVLTGLFLFKV